MRLPILGRHLLDLGMVLLVLLLMADRHTGNAAHEWGGIVWLCLLLGHAWIHRGWCRAVFRGGGVLAAHPGRVLITSALSVAVVGVTASAVPISHTVFAGMGGDGGLGARSVHVFCAHWCFLLAAAHLGLCWKRLPVRKVPLFQERRLFRLVFRAAPLVVAAYGAWAFLVREWVLPLTMNASFSAWTADDSAILLLLDSLAIFHLWAWGAYRFSAFATRKGSVQDQARTRDDRIWIFSPPAVPCRHGASAGRAASSVSPDSVDSVDHVDTKGEHP